MGEDETGARQGAHLSGGVEWVLPRRFHLVRHRDISGVSGVGIVAEGVVWSSGAVCLHWPGYPQATSSWASVHDLIAAHGHGGATEVVWLDQGSAIQSAALDQPDQPIRDGRGWPISDSASRLGMR